MTNRVIFDRRRDAPVLPVKKKDEAADIRHQEVGSSPKGESLPTKSSGFYPDSVKFDSLLRGCKRMLLRISAIFPFDIFPDEIIIDECKVSVVFREFFFSDDIHSINIEMIRDVEVETGPFFAKLQILPDGYPSKPLIVKYLRRKDAYQARSVIQGLMLAKRNSIDLRKVNDNDLLSKLEILGKTHNI